MEKLREKLGKSGWSLFIYYFFFYMAVAPYVSFVTAYYQEIGLTSSQIGIISGIGPVITVIGQFIWGRLADKAKYKNTVLLSQIIKRYFVFYFFIRTNPLIVIVIVFRGSFFFCY